MIRANPLLNPEAFGMELMAEHDIGRAEEFDVVCVWRHGVTQIWYVAADAGIDSSPFEYVERPEFTPVFTLDDVAEYARGWWDDEPEPARSRAVETLTSLVRASWRKAGVR